jgi:hypothetical protein
MSEQVSEFQTINGLRVLVPNWPASPQIGAFCTTRAGGISKAPFDSLNLGRYVNDEPLAVSENRVRVRALLPAEPVWLKQVHGTLVWDADLAFHLTHLFSFLTLTHGPQKKTPIRTRHR